MDQIFEPGFRGSAATGTRGAGLGLPLARRLAATVGAQVLVEPAAEGARVSIVVPTG